MRDSDRTEREGEKALQKPYDSPLGTPKSFAIRTDVEPDDKTGVKRLGNRTIEEGTIEPPEGGAEDAKEGTIEPPEGGAD
jgi:hypothetical protein